MKIRKMDAKGNVIETIETDEQQCSIDLKRNAKGEWSIECCKIYADDPDEMDRKLAKYKAIALKHACEELKEPEEPENIRAARKEFEEGLINCPCDSCELDYPACKASDKDIIWIGPGEHMIVECKKQKPVEKEAK